MSEYDEVIKGPLKIKSDSGVKKKKKSKHNKKLLEQVTNDSEARKEEKYDVKATKAEIAFQKMQEKMQKERIMQKASMTHKQRVEEFNRHLDSLTEHFDIPKVSLSVMDEPHLPVVWLPIVISLWLPTSFVITYLLAVSNGHVYPWLPSISATGALPPESCWFGFFTNIATFLLMFAGYIRHVQVTEFAKCRPESGPGVWDNRIASFAGAVSVLGLFVVANWQVTNEPVIHFVGAQCCFYVGVVYFSIQIASIYLYISLIWAKNGILITVFAFWMAPELNSLLILLLRGFLTVVMLGLAVGCTVTGHVARQEFTGKSTKDTLQWTPSQPGWNWHLAYTIMEWSLMLTFALNILTFYPDFRKIILEEPVLKMKRRCLNTF